MRCSTSSLERLAAAAAALWLAACSGGSAGHAELTVTHAVQTGDSLALAIHFHPSQAQLAALDQGVPLTLGVRATGPRGDAAWRVSLRYFPLSGRYQLHATGVDDRSFPLRGYLFAALENLHLRWPAAACTVTEPCRVTVAQEPAALPGPLRLPSLMERAWRVPSARAMVTGAAP